MTTALVTALLVLALLLALVAFAFAALDRLPPKAHLQGLFVLQGLVIVQAVVAMLRLGGWKGSVAELFGYLLMAFLLVPGGMVLAVEERSRYGTAILGVACLVLAVVVVRLQVVWAAGVPRG